MRYVIAVLMGIISGFLIYVMGAFFGAPYESAPVLVFLVFGGACGLSVWLLARKAKSISMVFRRGFLLGAAEWLVMGLASVIFTAGNMSRAITETGNTDAIATGAMMAGGGVVAAITGGASVFMAVVCLIGFAIAYFMGREMRDQSSLPTHRCPECAEMVQAEARKCRYCGTSLATVSSLAVLLLVASACATLPPPEATPRSVVEVQASFGRTWDAVIDYFATNTITIANMERASGLIVAAPVNVGVPARGQQPLANCGTIIGLPIYPDAAVWNVLVRGDTTRSTVRATVRFTHMNPDSKRADDCTTSGTWESQLESRVKVAAEGRPPT